jgi:replicative DNA helicase
MMDMSSMAIAVRPADANHAIVEIEQSLLGALLVMPDAFPAASALLSPESFAEPLHGRLYAAMAERAARGSLSDARSLAHDLGAGWNQPILGDLTFGAYVARLGSAAAPPSMVKSYARDIRDAGALRAVFAAVREVEASPGMASERLAAILTSVDEVRAGIAEKEGTRQPAGASSEALLTKVNAHRMGEPMLLGATTGWRSLDDVMGGYIPGQLVVLAGRPGMGKTTCGTSSAWQCASAGNGTLYFSLEMGRDDLAARLVTDVAFHRGNAIAYSAVKRGRVSDAQMESLLRADAMLKTLPLELDYSARLSVAEVSARVLAAKRNLAARGVDLRVVFIDYLKLLRAADRYKGNRVYEVGEITAGLRAVAKEQGVCIVLLAQLNRGVESREDKRPQLADLRESGDIEADADAVLFVYREAYYVATTSEYKEGDPSALARYDLVRDRLEIIAAKNRNGPTVGVDLFVDIAASAVRDPNGEG